MAKKSARGKKSSGKALSSTASRRSLPTIRTTTRFGWVPDLPDHRDHMYAAPMVVALPNRVDLSGGCPPVYDQGQLGSCTANAIGAAIQFERMKQKLPLQQLVPSRLFIYYFERALEGSIASDSGAQIRDGIKCVANKGACFEGPKPNQWPYDISKFTRQPPAACISAALKDRAVSYSRLISSLTQLRGCLASGYPFVFGFTVYEGFESPAVARSGELQMPAFDEKMVGGHAVLCVGYDDATQRFLVRNSWSAGWGAKGYFTMPYAYLTDTNLSDDFWTIRLISA